VDPDRLNEAVVGYDLAQEQGLEIGDTITIRDAAFTVVGIRERLRHDPDNDANYRIDVSLEALRRVLHDPFASGEITLLTPTARSQQEKRVYLQEMGTRLNVDRVWTIEDRLAGITRSYPATWSLKPTDTQGTVRHATTVYATILVLCSVLLLAVSALAAGGTTMDRLARDTRRVALLRALGSNEGMLLGDYLQVASILGVAGALPGVFGGWALSAVLNRVGPSRSAELLFTPRLGASVFFFIVLAAMVAAIAPVSRAVRQDATWTLYSASLTQSEAASLSPATGKVTHGGAEP
jgi:predicted lysophospholipase L1 biosynthesis ABC-type transport system permease subunit